MAVRPLKGQRCLVIDDFAQIRSALRAMLNDLGASAVDAVRSADEAIALLQARRYDVVLCDYNLGEGKDGQQVLEEVRYRQLQPYSASFLMVTAENALPMVLGAIEHQPDDYLVKPFVREVLRHRLLRVARRKEGLQPLDEVLAAGDTLRAIALCDELGNGELRRTLDLLKLKAELLLRIGEAQKAQAVYQAVIKAHDLPWAQFGLGRARVQLGRDSEARPVFDALLASNRCYLEVYDWLAALLERVGEPAEAQGLLETAVQLSSKSVRRQRLLGRVAERNGDLAVAESAYRTAITQGRNSCFAGAPEYVGLAQTLCKRGETRKALSVLRDARKWFREQPEDDVAVITSTAGVYRVRGQAVEAKGQLTEALALGSEPSVSLSADVALTLARECFAQAESESGLALIRELVRNAHDDAPMLEQVRSLFAEFDMAEQGAALIEKERSELVRLNNRGVELYRQGEVKQALELLMQAADGMPQNATTNLNAAKVLLHYMQERGREPRLLHCLGRFVERLRGHERLAIEHTRLVRAYRQLRSAPAETAAGRPESA